MTLPRPLEDRIAALRAAIGDADAPRLRRLARRDGPVQFNLDAIADLVEPQAGWIAAAEDLKSRTAAFAATSIADLAGRRAALRAVDELATALEGVPASVEARHLGQGW